MSLAGDLRRDSRVTVESRVVQKDYQGKGQHKDLWNLKGCLIHCGKPCGKTGMGKANGHEGPSSFGRTSDGLRL